MRRRGPARGDPQQPAAMRAYRWMRVGRNADRDPNGHGRPADLDEHDQFGLRAARRVEFVSVCLNDKHVTALSHDTQTQVCGCAMRAIEAQSSPTEFAQLVANWQSAATGTGQLASDLAVSTCLRASRPAVTSSTISATATTSSVTSTGSPGFVSCSAPGLAEGHLALPFTASGVGCAEGSSLLKDILGSIYPACHVAAGHPPARSCEVAGLTCRVESNNSSPGSPVQCASSGEAIRFTLPG